MALVSPLACAGDSDSKSRCGEALGSWRLPSQSKRLGECTFLNYAFMIICIFFGVSEANRGDAVY